MLILNNLIVIYCTLLDKIACISAFFSQKVRNSAIHLSLFSLSLIGIVAYCNDSIKRLVHYNDVVFLITTSLLVVILIASVDKNDFREKARDNNVNPCFWFGWLLCFVIMSASALFHYVRTAYFLWGILSLTVFPMIMIAWNRRSDYLELCNLAASYMVIASFVFLAINLLLVGIIERNEFLYIGYRGITANPNSNGLIVLPFFSSALYLLFTKRRYKEWYVFSIAICVMFAYISKTRTAELSMAIEIIIAILISYRHKDIFCIQHLKSRLLIVVLTAMACSIVFGCILMRLDDIDLNAYATSKTQSVNIEEANSNGMEIIDKFSSGRLAIWQTYLKETSFRGHGTPQKPIVEGVDATLWAHNNAIDIWYASGFPAFAGYVIWLMTGWLFVLKCIFSDKGARKEYMLSAVAFTGYFIEAMLEITIYPMYTGIVFLSYITLIPIALKK